MGSRETRLRLFTPRMFFETMIRLVSGKNKEGYLFSLLSVFRLHASIVPSPAAFCLFRKRISYRFFRDLLYLHLSQADMLRRTFNGYYVYAIDGFETEIPRSDEILKAGYSGRSLGSIRQTYYPRLYMSHCWDALNGITKDLVLQKTNEELKAAHEMIPKLESNSIALYDRLYFCENLVKSHGIAGNFFVARCKTEGGRKEIVEFGRDDSLRVKVIMVGKFEVRLFKIKNRQTGQMMVLATNLFEDWLSHEMMYKLYCIRWEVEVSFKDFVVSLKIEDFHAKNINGVFQELYARLWLMNFTRILVLRTHRVHLDPEARVYRKPNYKLLYTWVADFMKQVLEDFSALWAEFVQLIEMTMVKRKRRSRSYPRELKYSGKMYPRNSAVIVIGA